MEEEELRGGNSTGAARVAATVRLTAGPWTPRVQELLRTVRAAGVSEVPAPLGFDELGREVLSFLPGQVGHYPLPDWLWAEHVLFEAAKLLRRLHDASVPMINRRDGWKSPTHDPVEVICHNDFAPYNLVFSDGHVAGVIDFDTASPGPRVWDLAYLAYRLVPFAADAGAGSPSGHDCIARVRTLMTAYSGSSAYGFTTTKLLTVMAARLNELASFTEQRAHETGDIAFLAHAAMYRTDSAHALLVAESGRGPGDGL